MFEVGNIYKTRAGADVRIVCVDAEDRDYPVVGIMDGSPFTFTTHGKYYSDRVEPHAYDLQLPTSPYAHLKVDDPIWVRSRESSAWLPRHFAGLGDSGVVKVWELGKTSFTVEDNTVIPYPHCWPYPNEPE